MRETERPALHGAGGLQWPSNSPHLSTELKPAALSPSTAVCRHRDLAFGSRNSASLHLCAQCSVPGIQRSSRFTRITRIAGYLSQKYI
jgi:hypothetical protein